MIINEKKEKQLAVTPAGKFYRVSDIPKLFKYETAQNIEKLQDEIVQAFLNKQLHKSLYEYEGIGLKFFDDYPIEQFINLNIDYRDWKEIKYFIKCKHKTHYLKQFFDLDKFLIHGSELKKYSENMLKAQFITFEGVDGCGKSTQAQMLYNYFKNQGKEVILTREIGGTEIGEQLRNIIIKGQFLPHVELLLIMAARYEHIVKVILPALRNGKIVICDRFYDSTIAYQKSKIDENLIRKLHDDILIPIIPDITFFIDISPELTLKRIAKRKETDKFEAMDLSYHMNVYNTYVQLAQGSPKRIKTIDGLPNKETIHQTIVKELTKFEQDNE